MNGFDSTKIVTETVGHFSEKGAIELIAGVLILGLLTLLLALLFLQYKSMCWQRDDVRQLKTSTENGFTQLGGKLDRLIWFKQRQTGINAPESSKSKFPG